MARKRMIDPSFWDDLNVAKLSIAARLCFIGMVSNADDEGRIEADPRYIKRAVFGFDDDITSSDVADLLTEIETSCPSVVFYEADGRKLASFTNWRRYQYIQKPQPSRLPAPPLPDTYDTSNGTVSPNRIEENRKGIEQSGNARARDIALVELAPTDPPDPSRPPPEDDLIGSIYAEIFGRALQPAQRAYLAAHVTDAGHWRAVCAEWKLNGYKPGNLTGLVDRYRKPRDAPTVAGHRTRLGPPVGEPPELSEEEIKVKYAARAAELRARLPVGA